MYSRFFKYFSFRSLISWLNHKLFLLKYKCVSLACRFYLVLPFLSSECSSHSTSDGAEAYVNYNLLIYRLKLKLSYVIKNDILIDTFSKKFNNIEQLQKKKAILGMVAHGLKSSPLEVQAGRSLSPTWSTKQFPGQSGL